MTEDNPQENMEETPEEIPENHEEINPDRERALSLGWKPEEEFTGNPDDFKDEKSFLSYHDDHLGLARNELRDVREQLESLKQEAARNDKFFNLNMDLVRKDTEATLKKAVENGDTVSHAEALKTRDQLMAANEPTFDAIPHEVTEFQARNSSWYGKDMALTGAANGISADIARENPTLSIAQNLTETERRVKERFFKAQRPTPTPIERHRKKVVSRKSDFEELDAEYKKNYQDLVRRELYEDNDKGKQKYADSLSQFDEMARKQ